MSVTLCRELKEINKDSCTHSGGCHQKKICSEKMKEFFFHEFRDLNCIKFNTYHKKPPTPIVFLDFKMKKKKP